MRINTGALGVRLHGGSTEAPLAAAAVTMEWIEAPAECESSRQQQLPTPKVGEAWRPGRDRRARHR